MFRHTRIHRRVSRPLTRGLISVADLAYTKFYSVPHRIRLAQKYDQVTDENRYASLDILLTRLSSHVGRRMYRLHTDLEKYLPKFKSEGLDWHDIKSLSDAALTDLCDRVLGMSASEKVVFITAVDSRMCGVLTEGEVSDPQQLCSARGKQESGWRCGKGGHGSGVYFERKATAVDNTLIRQVPPQSDVQRYEERGIHVEVRPEPDFSIVGRLEHAERSRGICPCLRRAFTPHTCAMGFADSLSVLMSVILPATGLVDEKAVKCRCLLRRLKELRHIFQMKNAT